MSVRIVFCMKVRELEEWVKGSCSTCAFCKRGNGNCRKNSFTHEHKSREHLLSLMMHLPMDRQQ